MMREARRDWSESWRRIGDISASGNGESSDCYIIWGRVIVYYSAAIVFRFLRGKLIIHHFFFIASGFLWGSGWLLINYRHCFGFDYYEGGCSLTYERNCIWGVWHRVGDLVEKDGKTEENCDVCKKQQWRSRRDLDEDEEEIDIKWKRLQQVWGRYLRPQTLIPQAVLLSEPQ